MKTRPINVRSLSLMIAAGAMCSVAQMASAQFPVLIDVNPYSVAASADASPANFARLGNEVIFAANDGVNGLELWITDGTTVGTRLLKNINLGAGVGSSPANITSFGSRVVFTADDSINGRELWITDGTEAGTTLVKDIRPGTSGATFSSAFAAIGTFGTPGSFVAFGAADGAIGNEPYVTDGTTAGTFLLGDLRPGTTGSNASGWFADGTKAYFLANDGGAFGNELWSTDGTIAGTVRVTDIAPGSSSSGFSIDLVVNGWAYGAGAISGSDSEPTAVNLTTLEARRLADIRPGTTGSTTQEFVQAGTNVFFRATSNGTDSQLYKVTFDGNGDPVGAALVTDINPTGNDNVGNLASFNNLLYFNASNGIDGRELFVSDGTPAGTSLVVDINPGAPESSPLGLRVSNGKLYFSAISGLFGRELYVSDGTALGTTRLADLRLGQASGIAATLNSITLGSNLLFAGSGTTSGIELYSTDGTVPGTALLSEIRPQSTNAGSAPTSLTAVGNRLYFSATDEANGRELWTSDGTQAGTVLVLDSFPGGTGSTPNNGSPYGLTAFGTDLLYASNAGTTGSLTGIEYYKATGTTASIIADINPVTASSAPGSIPNLGILNGIAYFNATNGTTGAELYRYDGVNPPTIVQDLNPGTGGTNPANFAVFNGMLYFSAGFATAGGVGTELYRTDGTTISLVQDYFFGTSSSLPSSLFAFDGKLFMRATLNITGSELVVYDPATNSMDLVADVRPGTSGAFASQTPQFVNFNNELFFLGRDGLDNLQLFTSTGLPNSGATAKSNAIGSTLATLVQSGGYLYFNAGSGAGTNVQLYAYNGIENGGQAFPITINPSGGAFPTDLTDVNGRLYFAAVGATGGNELYRVTFDGSGVPNGAELVADLNPAGSSSPRNFRAIGTKLYFSADNGSNGEELWVLDTGVVTQRCNAADIAYDDGSPLPPIGPIGGVNNGVTEGDYNLFFARFFDSDIAVDIANDDGSPLPPFGTLTTNNGVTEADYNLFFSIFFDGCAF